MNQWWSARGSWQSQFVLKVGFFCLFNSLRPTSSESVLILLFFSFYSLGADVIYDPVCLPHLVRVLSTLLNQKKSYSEKVNDNCQWGSTCIDSNLNGSNHQEDDKGENGDGLNVAPSLQSRKGPLALIASVIRNIDTFNYFLALIDKASLTITDVTETLKPINLLPYMQSYNTTSIKLFIVSSKI